jgi:hypothetical protein
MKKIFILGVLAAASIAYADIKQLNAPLTQTQLINVQAIASSEPSSYATGECFMRSLWSNRADAWRCKIDSPNPSPDVYDPCFVVPNSTHLVVCGIQPGVNNKGFTVQISGLPDKPAWAAMGYWSMQLADGTYCRTLDIAPLLPPFVTNEKGEVIESYGIIELCSNNPAMTGRSSDDVNLAGSAILEESIDQGKIWTAKRIYYSAVPNRSDIVRLDRIEKVQIAKVWQ